MKFIFTLLFFVLGCASPLMAQVSFPGAYNTVGSPVALDTSSTNITAGAWVELVASPAWACSAVLIHNSGAQPIKVGKGAAMSEVDAGLVFPIAVSAFVPFVVKKGQRLAVRSMGGTQSSGIITLSCFQ